MAVVRTHISILSQQVRRGTRAFAGYCLTGLCLLGIGSASVAASDTDSLPDGTIVSVEPVEELLLDESQLRELVSPIALYPDDLLAIVLPASTYPLQIVAAARFLESNGSQSDAEPDATWDESIVALLNYPEALALLNEDLNWTWELGQAVIAQQPDVLGAVQVFRDEAYAAGNLASDEKQVVTVEKEAVVIKSADPEVVYVPYYEPEQVTVYQTERVIHHYPRAYPVYYYPYTSRHLFYGDHYDYGFWGVSSIFALHWPSFHVSHRHHGHRLHRYHGRRYHNDHFRKTRRYHRSDAHHRRVVRRTNRLHERRRHRGHDVAGWRPDRRFAGNRPGFERRLSREQRGKRIRREL